MMLDHELLGPPDGPVVMLHNSLGCTRQMWKPQLAPLLEAGVRVLWYDMRGHGGSAVLPGPYTLEDLGNDAAQILASPGIPAATHVGLSLGGMVAMWLAEHRRELVRSLVLCSTSAELGPSQAWADRAVKARGEGCAAMADLLIPRWFTAAFATAEPDQVHEIREQIRCTPSEGFAGCCEAIASMDIRRSLADITAPTTVLVGQQDPGTPPDHARTIAATIPGAALTVLDPGAHLLNLERPAEVTAAILDAIPR